MVFCCLRTFTIPCFGSNASQTLRVHLVLFVLLTARIAARYLTRLECFPHKSLYVPEFSNVKGN